MRTETGWYYLYYNSDIGVTYAPELHILHGDPAVGLSYRLAAQRIIRPSGLEH